MFEIHWAGLGQIILAPRRNIVKAAAKLVHPINQSVIFKNFSSTRQYFEDFLTFIWVVLLALGVELLLRLFIWRGILS